MPYPVDYGGVFDLFFKIKSLSEAGVKIHLHCFEYGRGKQDALNKYCVEVHYYGRLKGLRGLSASLPYIVASRADNELLVNLQKDNYPILMEGMHCTHFLHTGQLPKERCFVRLHNVEYSYYHQLGETTASKLKKIFYKRESKLLKKYEASLAGKATFWTVTEKDLEVFNREFGYNSVDYLPLFLPDHISEWNGEHGHFCLYHGENWPTELYLLPSEPTFEALKDEFLKNNPIGDGENIIEFHQTMENYPSKVKSLIT